MNKLCLHFLLWMSCVCLVFLKDIRLCPFRWITSIASRSCMKMVWQKKTWTEARKKCQYYHADLMINYQMDIKNAKNILKVQFWIGLNDRRHEGAFNWLDRNEEVFNVPWSRNHHDNTEDKDCVVMYFTSDAEIKLHVKDCNATANFICEIHPTCRNNTFGQRCSEICNPKCGGGNNSCDSFTGYCLSGCDDGYLGNRCETECTNSTFGAGCSKICSETCGGPNDTCHNINGICLNGCDAGYQGEICQDPCTNNTYGPNCSATCSSKCAGVRNACNRFTGFCFSGCDVGYQGGRCDASCSDGTFGANCSEICPRTCGGPNNACTNIHGFCSSGCDDGYLGERCQAICTNNTFGANCSEKCSQTCGGLENACDHVNGFCLSGCDDGYAGKRCQSKSYKRLAAMTSALIFMPLILTCCIMSLRRHAPKEETVQASDGSEGWMVRLRAPKASSTAVYPARSISEGRRLNHSARSGSTDRHSKSSPRSVSEGRRLNHPARSGSTGRHSKSSSPSVSDG